MIRALPLLLVLTSASAHAFAEKSTASVGALISTSTITSSGSSLTVKGSPADSASAVGVVIDTGVNFTTTGAKIASFRNNGTEKSSIDKDGNLLRGGTTNQGILFAGSSTSVKAENGSIVNLSDNSVNMLVATATNVAIPDGTYLQAADNNAGAPPAAACDNDNERGRLSIDTTNNRLYICNGATRGWDHIVLTD